MIEYYTDLHSAYIRALFLYKNGVSIAEKKLGLEYLMDLSQHTEDDEYVLFNTTLIELMNEGSAILDKESAEAVVNSCCERILMNPFCNIHDFLLCLRNKNVQADPHKVVSFAYASRHLKGSADDRIRLKVLVNEIVPFTFPQDEILKECFEARAESYFALNYLHQYFSPKNPEHYAYLTLPIFERSLQIYFSSDKEFEELLKATNQFSPPEVRADVFDLLIKTKKMEKERKKLHDMKFSDAIAFLQKNHFAAENQD